MTVAFGSDLSFPAPDPTIAQDILAGRYHFGGLTPEAAGPNGRPISPWAIEPPSERWAAELHAFDWIHHLRAAGRGGPRRAAALAQGWLKRPKRALPDVAWRSDVAARRLLSWIDLEPMLFGDMEGAGAELRFDVFRRHMRHCRRRKGAGEWSRALTAVAAARAALRLGGSGGVLERTMRSCLKTISDCVDKSDGLPERRADHAATLLAHCLALAAGVKSLGASYEMTLKDVIGRLAAALSYVRHRDGYGVLFQNALEVTPDRLDRLIERAHGRPAKTGVAINGFRRLAVEDAVGLVDLGAPDGKPDPCLSGGAFEFGAPKRLIVGCGAPDTLSDPWRSALCRAAAWSGLTLEIDGDGSSAKRRPGVSNFHETEDGACLSLCVKHGEGPGALIHERVLTLSDSGRTLAGDDILMLADTRKGAAPSGRFAVRFHLHPHVRASLTRDGTRVLLAFEDGQGWIFTTKGARLTMDESVYAGDGSIRRSRQIVLDGTIGDAQEPRIVNRVTWRLSRQN